ncbi:MAG: hypothetical protein H3C47_01575 [Candidatus Cloacimonetes bacterium]|nr:hypothetical protein [Candidatus Cloacimonadota bacterium]
MKIIQYCHQEGRISKEELKKWPEKVPGNLIWLSLKAENSSELHQAFSYLDLPILDLSDEISKRWYWFKDREILLIKSFTLEPQGDDYKVLPLVFCTDGNFFFSLSCGQAPDLDDSLRRVENHRVENMNGAIAFCIFLESRITMLWELVEKGQREIYAVLETVRNPDTEPSGILNQLLSMFDGFMLLRENVTESQRILYNFLKGSFVGQDLDRRVRIMVEQTESLLRHMDSLTEALKYAQDSLRGRLHEEQSRIVKVLTVLTLILMPPTLIAGIYGMNFKTMPELEWGLGYPTALGMMLLSSAGPLLFFRWKRWL